MEDNSQSKGQILNLGLMDRAGAGRRFAWDGFSFLAPPNWDLAQYHFGDRVSSLQMEDEVALRFEFEWTRAARAMDPKRVRTRYGAMARALTEQTSDSREVSALPPGWTAFIYTMPGARQLATAYWLAPAAGFFCFARFHFEESDPARAGAMVRQMACSMTLHAGATLPWELYDLAFTLDRDFRLAGTSLEAGRKLLVFQWRLRRLFLWQISFADIMLKRKSPAAWCSDFLNGFKGIRGPVFFPLDGETLDTRRRWNYPAGHYEEIGRGCFRYRAWCRRLPEKNALVLAVYQYRKAADLDKTASLQFT